MTRTNPYPMHDPTDYSMLTQPKLRLNDAVIVWNEDEGGEWVQARVVDATFNRGKKCWEYSAVVEFVDETTVFQNTIHFELPQSASGGNKVENTSYLRRDSKIKDWHYFSDEELEKPLIEEFYTETVGEGFYQHEQKNVRDITLNMYIVIKK